ncbi:uncharacterized protein DUF421 [Hasllibacter halocynthiae]|uniref:Uncharacterized protein DUF421 n=1 Tax=Hasllibacter halocynthiae TaxID=595589 RepID=A0A2T0X7H0_9RHOB|nr:YetF domain-containing protein [Hasllibacter halocynthiae]PRY94873.1 uncharacterized protein DUF421 [Hasllibacter halocynthiae]
MPDIPDWITPLTDALILIPLIMLYVRISGLRTFAKMSAHDFISTVAVGSTLAATVLNYTIPWWQGAIGLAGLIGVQWLVGIVRSRAPAVQRWSDNEPLVLMRNGTVRHDALRTARITDDDLRQKLRVAGISDRSEVALMVLETTGDTSILKEMPEEDLLVEVRGVEGPPRQGTAA